MKYRSKESYQKDDRVVLTLDAGGTNLVFTAMQGGKAITEPITKPCLSHDLDVILKDIKNGFEEVAVQVRKKIYAVSFAFPGPADYRTGIIGDLPNLPSFRGGVALGPFLERALNLPVFINNDANLFALGEYIFGFVPWVNLTLEEKGTGKKYHNLIGITLGSGFGCGIICNGQLNIGDNSNGGELWLARNKLFPELCADASIGNNKIRRLYSKLAHIKLDEVPDSRGIFKIARGEQKGNQDAAKRAFALMGEVIGDALAHASLLLDGLTVIGGGLSGAYEFFMPALMQELNGTIKHLDNVSFPRIAQKAYFLNDEKALNEFVQGKTKKVKIPFSNESIDYDSAPRIGLGISQLGASKAIALGAYVFAVSQ